MGKRFVISDESLNEFGFWVKTSGVDIAQFIKNPIMLWMHSRAWRGTKDEVLPIGHWENITVENGQILADPVFDEDEFSQSIFKKVESGTIRMASAGLAQKIWSEAAEDIKPGQTRATLLKSILKEASICDIGANDNTLALYDENDNLIKLSGETKDKKYPPLLTLKSNLTMKKVIKLFSDLGEDSSEDQIVAKVIELQSANKVLQDKADGYEQQRMASLKSEAEMLTEAAVKDGRIEAAAKEHFIKLFESNHDSTKASLAALKPHQKVADKIGNQDSKENPLEKLSWDDIDKKGELTKLRADFPDLYKEKFKEKFGREPKN
jgi:hypothetical protein